MWSWKRSAAEPVSITGSITYCRREGGHIPFGMGIAARPGGSADTIKRFKTNIAAYKKQLAFSGKIPPIVFATDFNNNHGYTQQQNIEITAARKLEQLPTREDIIKRLPQNTDIDEDPGEIIV